MPYYTRVFSALPLTFARSSPLMAEFDRIQAGFTAIETELTPARQGQATLLANLGRYLSTFAPAPGDVNMGGYRVGGAADGSANGDYVTVRQLNAAVFSVSLPAQTAQAGRVIRTDGTSAAWADWWGAPVTLTVANNGTTLALRTTYHIDTSGGPFSVTLPTMAVADWIKVLDRAGQCAVNNLTINAGGNGTFRDGDTTLLVDVPFDSFELLRTSSGVIEQ